MIETALGAELTEHLGYPPGQSPPGGAGNVRNGSTGKKVQTELGPVEVKTPRDRAGTFEPQLVAKRQTRLAGLDEKILDLYAGGMSVRDIESHLQRLYGTTALGRDTISRVTDAVLADVQAWRTRPLERVYPIVYLDALMVKVREDPRPSRTRACYLAIGVTVRRGARGARAVVAGDRGRQVLARRPQRPAPPRRRGRPRRMRRRADRVPRGGSRPVFPQAWVQHLHRSPDPGARTARYVAYQDRKKVAAALKPVYGAVNVEAAEHALAAFDETWGAKYPMIAASWRERWNYIVPFLSLPADLRRAVYTTNSIENLNRQIRKSIKTRGHFPDEQAATKLIYLAILRAEGKWRQAYNWTTALRGLKIHFGDRLPD